LADEPPALSYIAETLATSYRKEIDQEENVWRSLPFFAATLALQLAALFQIIDKLPDPAGWTGRVAFVLLALAGLCTIIALGFLAASIYPAKFDYVAKEPALLQYAWDLIRNEQAPENLAQKDPFSALVTLKGDLSRQYAVATDHNRQINQRRERWRSIAGLAALGSVLATVFLVATSYTHYLSIRAEKDKAHVAARAIADPAPARVGAGDDPLRNAVQPPGAGAATDAGRHQGVVGAP
jgi:hypothetical protein